MTDWIHVEVGASFTLSNNIEVGASAEHAFDHIAFQHGAFDVEFFDPVTPQDETWTAKAQQAETWTPKTKQSETWTVED